MISETGTHQYINALKSHALNSIGYDSDEPGYGEPGYTDPDAPGYSVGWGISTNNALGADNSVYSVTIRRSSAIADQDATIRLSNAEYGSNGAFLSHSGADIHFTAGEVEKTIRYTADDGTKHVASTISSPTYGSIINSTAELFRGVDGREHTYNDVVGNYDYFDYKFYHFGGYFEADILAKSVLSNLDSKITIYNTDSSGNITGTEGYNNDGGTGIKATNDGSRYSHDSNYIDESMSAGYYKVRVEGYYGSTGAFQLTILSDGYVYRGVDAHFCPVAIDLDGDGVETLGVEAGVLFDQVNDGTKDKTGWISSDDGMLVSDVNGDGIINNGTELLGQSYVKEDGTRATDGYDALSDFDSNNDGVINSDDERFNELKVWQDKNSDGITDEGELLTLREAKIAELKVSATVNGTTDENGNIITSESTYTDLDGNIQLTADISFETQLAKANEDVLILSEEIVCDFDALAAANSGITEIDMVLENQIINDVNLEDLLTMTQDTNDLIFVGDNGDKIDLSKNEDWIKSDEKVTIVGKDGEFDEYVHKDDPLAKLFVDEDITVI
jgi:hypothetical protein